MFRISAAAALGCALANALIAPAGAQSYYTGKRLTILINYAAGGPADVEGRVIARHIAKHIEGNPTIVVQNMDGAGGLIGKRVAGLTADAERVGGTVKSVARTGDEIALVLENGWIIPMDNVEYIDSETAPPPAGDGNDDAANP